MGQDVFTVPVINCAYFVFDWDRFTSDNPYSFNELIKEIRQDKFDFVEQVDLGYKFKKRDLDWWMEQGPKLASRLLHPPETSRAKNSAITSWIILRALE
jgi:hypothetical protein